MRGETIRRLRAPLTADGRGASVRDWEAAQERPIHGVMIAPAGSLRLSGEGRQGAATDLDVLLPLGADIEATDRLSIRGDVYRLEGEPAEWRSGFGSLFGGLAATVRKVEG